MRYVNCTEEFIAAVNDIFVHSQTDRNEAGGLSDIINDVSSALLNNPRVRFFIALGSIAPLLLCAFVSLNRRVSHETILLSFGASRKSASTREAGEWDGHDTVR